MTKRSRIITLNLSVLFGSLVAMQFGAYGMLVLAILWSIGLTVITSMPSPPTS